MQATPTPPIETQPETLEGFVVRVVTEAVKEEHIRDVVVYVLLFAAIAFLWFWGSKFVKLLYASLQATLNPPIKQEELFGDEYQLSSEYLQLMQIRMMQRIIESDGTKPNGEIAMLNAKVDRLMQLLEEREHDGH